MTKTLTEQWRDGTLERGYYYYKTKVGVKVIGYQCFGLKFPYDYYHNTIDSVEEFLAPVPDYSEYQALKDNCEFTHTVLKGSHQKITQLENKLEIATKALKEIRKRIEDFNDDPMNKIGFMAYGALHECLKESKKALKEMEGVK